MNVNFFETVESRRLFSQGVFPTPGTDLSGDNTITFHSLSGGGAVVVATDTATGAAIQTIVFGTGTTSIKIDAGAGNDLVASDGPMSIPVYLIGNSGNDTLQGGDSNDTIDGSAGNDLIFLSGGNDVIGGGNGTDTFSAATILSSTNYVAYYKLDGTGTADDYLISGPTILKTDNVDVENLIGGPNADELLGSSSANILDGAAGNDSIYGGSGNDTLYGQDGNDYLDGGPDTDFIRGYAGNDTLVGGSGAHDYCEGDDGNDRFNLADSVGNADTGVGGAGSDVLDASDADDIFTT